MQELLDKISISTLIWSKSKRTASISEFPPAVDFASLEVSVSM